VKTSSCARVKETGIFESQISRRTSRSSAILFLMGNCFLPSAVFLRVSDFVFIWKNYLLPGWLCFFDDDDEKRQGETLKKIWLRIYPIKHERLEITIKKINLFNKALISQSLIKFHIILLPVFYALFKLVIKSVILIQSPSQAGREDFLG